MAIDTNGHLLFLELLNSQDEDLQIELCRVLSHYQYENAVKKPFVSTLEYNHIEPYLSKDGSTFIADKMPEFPEGERGLRSYIAHTVMYPIEAQKKRISGRVYVSFLVKKNGKIEDVKIAKGVHYLLEAEAIRVVRAMPNWIPGTKNGEAVDISYTIPINFELR